MEFDDLVHQPTRLRIFSYLYQHGETSFPDLREDLGMTHGNLASHIEKMEDADCVTVEKRFVDRKPQTTYELTDLGEEKFEAHVETLETLVGQLRDEE